ncbi:hypothetical protein [[Mycoplasma] anseris]|uniref:Uncharacterized protein n=1 Tax=[Mycoplasma] anseris TaxID=92400 RepID=A0A2Z4NCA8_9BACT|nr:hypothetical protein [[Mycoplasma] anseris]AWX69184.1 hypothetical protein DP065_00180 [[Mycoplasma] anseris]
MKKIKLAFLIFAHISLITILFIVIPLYFTYFNKLGNSNTNHNQPFYYYKINAFYDLYFFRDFGSYLIASIADFIFSWISFAYKRISNKEIFIGTTIVFVISIISIVSAIILVGISTPHLVQSITLFVLFTIFFLGSIITINLFLYIKLKKQMQMSKNDQVINLNF